MSNEQQVRIYNPSEEMVKNAAVSGMDGYRALCRGSRGRLRGLLGASRQGAAGLEVPFTQVLDQSNAPFFKWFADGKLNVSYNCLDRNVANGLGDKVALIFEADGGEVTRITYKDLLSRVSSSPTPCAAWASRRAIASSSTCRCRSKAWSRCRPAPASAPPTRSCSAASRPRRCPIASRTRRPWLVITSDGQFRGGKASLLKPIADEALSLGGCVPSERHRRQAHRCRRSPWSPAATSGSDDWSPPSPDVCEPGGSRPSTRCSCSTPPAPPASRKGVQHAPAATCCRPCCR